MAMETLTLVANPGSASRKYAVFDGDEPKGDLHFEYESGQVICTVSKGTDYEKIGTDLQSVDDAVHRLRQLLEERGLLGGKSIGKIGIRVVAPTGFFLSDHVMDDETIDRLETVKSRAPLHIEATLNELRILRETFPDAMIVGVSDSAFHATKPDFAWNYGLPLHDADLLEIKRFGYHGLSIASVVRQLEAIEKLPPKLVVCHLGSGASVTAVRGGKSRDTTMGYSPLEGLIMATRAGSVDATAVQVLKNSLGLDDAGLEAYLNRRSGLLGLSDGASSDIRELLEREAASEHYAYLALATYVFNVQKAVGQMTAALGGADMLVFTGTVGERSAVMRDRIVKPFHYLDFQLDHQANQAWTAAKTPTCISRLAHSRPIYVVPAAESTEIVRHTQGFDNSANTAKL